MFGLAETYCIINFKHTLTQLATSIIQRVKNELKVSEDLSSTELYDLLHKHRSSQHPDNFTDKEIKDKAEENFKEINNLLQELLKYIEQERFHQKPSEIVLHQKDFELVKSKQENVNFEGEINRLKDSIKVAQIINDRLEKELAELRSEKVDEKTKQLIHLYKPTKQNLFSLGIIFFLTLVITVLSKVKEIAAIISEYSPFSPNTIKIFIFSILVLIPLIYLRVFYEQSRISYLTKKIKTPIFISRFVSYMDDRDMQDVFTELAVYDYVSNEVIPKNKTIRFIFSKVFRVYNEIIMDGLKDIFISNLIEKQLIEISNSERLDRNFKILKRYRF